MLVLQRHAGESIVIAGIITVTVLAIHGTRVKIGIQASPTISIMRGELLRKLAARGSRPSKNTP